jgi:hypothetical protein
MFNCVLCVLSAMMVSRHFFILRVLVDPMAGAGGGGG